jgi:methylase of polypeptide subunit release factors
VSERDERAALTRFAARYATPSSDAAAEVERLAIGANWGANGYTTVAQADELACRLALRPSDVVLDLGTGRGWPGLYLATTTGCTVVGSDMPIDALMTARHRAESEHLDDRVGLVVAAGRRQPFRPKSFDAIVHTDVLC